MLFIGIFIILFLFSYLSMLPISIMITDPFCMYSCTYIMLEYLCILCLFPVLRLSVHTWRHFRSAYVRCRSVSVSAESPATEALMYLANCTRLDIVFVINLLERFSLSPTRRYWNEIKNVFYYLRRITNFSLFYFRGSKQEMIGYAIQTTCYIHINSDLK